MSYSTKTYTDYVKRLCALIGVPKDGLTSAETDFFQEYFQTNIAEIWTRENWTETCPYGEARLVGNMVEYANNYTSTAGGWTPTGAAQTDNQFANPTDARITAGKLTEDSSTGTHSLAPTAITIIPALTYQFSVFVRPNGRGFVQLAWTDTSTYSAYLSLSGVGSVVSQSGCTASCQQVGNGFYLCAINVTSSTTATTATTTLSISSTGTSTSYTGNGSSGAYIWGWWAGQSQNFPANLLIPYNQTGELPIDAVFNVWKNNPNAAGFPRGCGYQMTPDGIQVIPGTDYYNWQNYPYFGFAQPLAGTLIFYPVVFIYYRSKLPNYSGEAYDATATYTVADPILFTDSSGVQNFYVAATATTAGQSPTTNPTSWTYQPFPSAFFKYTVYGSYSDWLRMDGQADKAQGAEQVAEEEIAIQQDIQERQVGNILPMKVYTHVTSQVRY